MAGPHTRKAVWRAAANPGIVLVDGEIAGIWRRNRDHLDLEAFQPLPDTRGHPDAAVIASTWRRA
ncbi:winged helix DNA-binding domain-containing protein [Streptosporangiaceae bacterium NEAU-GS5]|nr:winged helix DNA-binding domain-containing protein [Streptosporangiaceae bacterium NEAU-GS5]